MAQDLLAAWQKVGDTLSFGFKGVPYYAHHAAQGLGAAFAGAPILVAGVRDGSQFDRLEAVRGAVEQLKREGKRTYIDDVARLTAEREGVTPRTIKTWLIWKFTEDYLEELGIDLDFIPKEEMELFLKQYEGDLRMKAMAETLGNKMGKKIPLIRSLDIRGVRN